MDITTQPERQRVADPAFAARVHAVWRAFIAGEPLPCDWPRYDEDAPTILHIDQGGIALERDGFADRLALWQKP
jgi:carboxylesterase type B